MNQRASHTSSRALSWDAFQVCVIGMIITYMWRAHQAVAFMSGLQLATVVSLAAIFAALLDRYTLRSPRALSHPVVVAAGTFVFMMFMSIPGAVLQMGSLMFAVTVFPKTLLLFLLVLLSVRGLQDVERYSAFVVLGGVIYVGCALLFSRAESGVGFSGLPYFDQNGLAMMSACTLPIALYFVWRKNGWIHRAAALAATGLLLYGIALSGSRTGIVGLGALVAYFLFSLREVPGLTRIGIAAAIVLATVATGPQLVDETVTTLTNPSQDYNWAGESPQGRLEIWKRGVRYMENHPLGVGVRNFNAAEGRFAEPARSQQVGEGWKWSAAHNTYVQVGAELGVLGLLAFLAVLALAFRSLRRASRRARGDPNVPARMAVLGRSLTAALVVFCVTGLFLSQAYIDYLWGLLGIIVGLDVAVGRASSRRLERSRESRPGDLAPVHQPTN